VQKFSIIKSIRFTGCHNSFTWKQNLYS